MENPSEQDLNFLDVLGVPGRGWGSVEQPFNLPGGASGVPESVSMRLREEAAVARGVQLLAVSPAAGVEQLFTFELEPWNGLITVETARRSLFGVCLKLNARPTLRDVFEANLETRLRVLFKETSLLSISKN